MTSASHHSLARATHSIPARSIGKLQQPWQALGSGKLAGRLARPGWRARLLASARSPDPARARLGAALRLSYDPTAGAPGDRAEYSLRTHADRRHVCIRPSLCVRIDALRRDEKRNKEVPHQTWFQRKRYHPPCLLFAFCGVYKCE